MEPGVGLVPWSHQLEADRAKRARQELSSPNRQRHRATADVAAR